MARQNNRQRVYRVQSNIDTGAPLQLFVNADERSVIFLRQLMAEGPVRFVFRKEDGEITIRTGTLQPDIIAAAYHFRDTSQGRNCNPRYLRYWDISRGGWRTVYAERLIGYFEAN